MLAADQLYWLTNIAADPASIKARIDELASIVPGMTLADARQAVHRSISSPNSLSVMTLNQLDSLLEVLELGDEIEEALAVVDPEGRTP